MNKMQETASSVSASVRSCYNLFNHNPANYCKTKKYNPFGLLNLYLQLMVFLHKTLKYL